MFSVSVCFLFAFQLVLMPTRSKITTFWKWSCCQSLSLSGDLAHPRACFSICLIRMWHNASRMYEKLKESVCDLELVSIPMVDTLDHKRSNKHTMRQNEFWRHDRSNKWRTEKYVSILLQIQAKIHKNKKKLKEFNSVIQCSEISAF